MRRPVSYVVAFHDDRAEFRPADIHNSPDLARRLSIRARVTAVLKRGPQRIEALAEALGERSDSVRRTVQRYDKVFVHLGEGQYALLQKT